MQSNALVAACQEAGFTPHIGHVAANNLSRLNLVAAGLGVAVVSAAMQRMSIEGVVYRRLNAPQLKIPLDIAARRSDASVVVQNFIRMAKRTARTFRMDWPKLPRSRKA
jgi:DNA-binding transcriptional LysR family regulator